MEPEPFDRPTGLPEPVPPPPVDHVDHPDHVDHVADVDHVAAVPPVVPVEHAPATTAIPVVAPATPRRRAPIALGVLAGIGIVAAVVFGFLLMGAQSDKSDLEDDLTALDGDLSDSRQAEAAASASATSEKARADAAETKAADEAKRADAAETKAEDLQSSADSAAADAKDLAARLAEAVQRADEGESQLSDAESAFADAFASGLQSGTNVTDEQASCFADFMVEEFTLREIVDIGTAGDAPPTDVLVKLVTGATRCGIDVSDF